MPNPNADHSKLPMNVSQRVLTGIQERMVSETGPRLIPAGLMREEILVPTKRRRIELLDLKKATDKRRWQIIHNDSDRYEFISEKFTTVRADRFVDYTCLIMYYELGDELPMVKDDNDLRREDESRMGVPVMLDEDDPFALDLEVDEEEE